MNDVVEETMRPVRDAIEKGREELAALYALERQLAKSVERITGRPVARHVDTTRPHIKLGAMTEEEARDLQDHLADQLDPPVTLKPEVPGLGDELARFAGQLRRPLGIHYEHPPVIALATALLTHDCRCQPGDTCFTCAVAPGAVPSPGTRSANPAPDAPAAARSPESQAAGDAAQPVGAQ